MSWLRLGLVYSQRGTKPWAQTHTALPVPVQIQKDVFRVFFSARSSDNRSSVDWIDLDLSGPPRVIGGASAAALSPGSDGAFDDSGVGIGSIVPKGDKFLLYYMGWNLGVRAPWRNSIGLATTNAGLERFERFSKGPILDRSPEDPYTLSYPWVLQLADDDWRMWYGSNLTWGANSTDMSHVIKMARSQDGIRWERDGSTAVGFDAADEYALARPSVVKVGSSLLMCFAHRGNRYLIGGAVSRNGLQWTRMDTDLGLGLSADGWDSEMTCYPALFWFHGKLWLLYNGNGYGATGFGIAVWDGEFPFT
ncbi:hypothetical protein [Microvirga sp. TS319]|uniref:hypothetical protein n=1 Tax=Microvirga sp. TS319 TaxID=3241165 RepID=UPI00351A4EDE